MTNTNATQWRKQTRWFYTEEEARIFAAMLLNEHLTHRARIKPHLRIDRSIAGWWCRFVEHTDDQTAIAAFYKQITQHPIAPRADIVRPKTWDVETLSGWTKMGARHAACQGALMASHLIQHRHVYSVRYGSKKPREMKVSYRFDRMHPWEFREFSEHVEANVLPQPMGISSDSLFDINRANSPWSRKGRRSDSQWDFENDRWKSSPKEDVAQVPQATQ